MSAHEWKSSHQPLLAAYHAYGDHYLIRNRVAINFSYQPIPRFHLKVAVVKDRAEGNQLWTLELSTPCCRRPFESRRTDEELGLAKVFSFHCPRCKKVWYDTAMDLRPTLYLDDAPGGEQRAEIFEWLTFFLAPLVELDPLQFQLLANDLEEDLWSLGQLLTDHERELTQQKEANTLV